MLRQIIAGAVVLSLGSSSFAGVAITLLPTTPYPVGGYEPGQQINIDVMAQLTSGTPSVPGPGGTTTSIRVRMMQFDLSDTDAALDVRPVERVYDAPGKVGFWDFDSTTACMLDDDSCGSNYFIDGHIDASDHLLNITYTGLTSSSTYMITLNQFAPKRVGELWVTLPLEPGNYVLDVLNANETDINRGAEIRWGFGSVADPTDPTSPLRASEGAITGGQLRFYSPCPDCIPEPGTLALLGLGGLAVGKRRGLYS